MYFAEYLKQQEIIQHVAQSIGDFTIDIHKNIAGKEKGNFICSPLSAHAVLSMAAYGARGRTAEEMRKVLHLPDNDHVAIQGFQSFIDNLNDVPSVILKLANKIYISDRIDVKEQFKRFTETYFRCESQLIDVTNPTQTANAINEWCCNKTNGRIQEILSPHFVTPLLTMVLLNAVYFKGDWKNKFNVMNTRVENFYVNRNITVRVPMMNIRELFLYKEITELNAQCVQLPYKNADVVMEIIMPKEIDGLEHIERNLEKTKIDRVVSGYSKYDVIFSLPKFRIESLFDLNSFLKDLGASEMFSLDADFGHISDTPLKIDNVLQKAFIEVDEEGTEAAAVTCVMMSFGCATVTPTPVVVMKVDRPFIYRIVYNNNIIFTGRNVNPLGS